MSSAEDFPPTGIIALEDEDGHDSMDTMAHAILDDVLYNLIHDIVLKTHREEKISRANTAAMIVEQLAGQSSPQAEVETTAPAPSTPKKKKHKVVQTPGAVYEDGSVYVVGNPLETTKEIRCPKCGLPRMLYPAIGTDSQVSDPTIEYCKRRPFVDKPGFDIYGQPFRQSGPVKSTRKPKQKDLVVESQAEPGSSFDSPAPSPPVADPKEKPVKLIFPDIECHRCGQAVRVNRFSAHLSKCMGISGRASSRAAALKINGQANGSQTGSTPPVSRKSTPLPPDKVSPLKRDAEDLGEDGDDGVGDSPKKKKLKKVVTKKWKSGKITVNGKAVTEILSGDVKDVKEKGNVVKDKTPQRQEALVPEPQEVSESSQTLSSP